MLHGVCGTVNQAHTLLSFDGKIVELGCNMDWTVKNRRAIYDNQAYVLGYDGWCCYRGMEQCYEFHDLKGRIWKIDDSFSNLVDVVFAIVNFDNMRFLIVNDWLVEPFFKANHSYMVTNGGVHGAQSV